MIHWILNWWKLLGDLQKQTPLRMQWWWEQELVMQVLSVGMKSWWKSKSKRTRGPSASIQVSNYHIQGIALGVCVIKISSCVFSLPSAKSWLITANNTNISNVLYKSQSWSQRWTNQNHCQFYLLLVFQNSHGVPHSKLKTPESFPFSWIVPSLSVFLLLSIWFQYLQLSKAVRPDQQPDSPLLLLLFKMD